MLNTEQLIQYLRISVNIQEKGTEQDPAYLSMSDEDLLLYLKISLSRNYPEVSDIKYMPEDSVFGLIILAKKELFLTLAVKEAPKYDMGADNNNYLKFDQRFQHYMKLVEQADKEYSDWLENGGGEDSIGTVRTYNTIIPSRYNTRYNYENTPAPKPRIMINSVGENFVEVSWSVSKLSRFKSYKVFISTEPIVDMFKIGSHVDENAKMVQEIQDIHQTQIRLEGLETDVRYYVAVEVTNMAGIKGYSQADFVTGGEE